MFKYVKTYIKNNNKLSIIGDKLKGLTEKYGYVNESINTGSNSSLNKLEPDYRLEILEWLEQYIDEIKQRQEKSFYEREEEEKVYIAQINSKFNEMAMENAKLKDIVSQYNFNENNNFNN